MTLPRVPRLDIDGVLRRLDVSLTYEGPCPGGQVGAAYVRWPDGHRSVLTHGPDKGSLLEVARAAGIGTASGAGRTGTDRVIASGAVSVPAAGARSGRMGLIVDGRLVVDGVVGGGPAGQEREGVGRR